MDSLQGGHRAEVVHLDSLRDRRLHARVGDHRVEGAAGKFARFFRELGAALRGGQVAVDVGVFDIGRDHRRPARAQAGELVVVILVGVLVVGERLHDDLAAHAVGLHYPANPDFHGSHGYQRRYVHAARSFDVGDLRLGLRVDTARLCRPTRTARGRRSRPWRTAPGNPSASGNPRNGSCSCASSRPHR